MTTQFNDKVSTKQREQVFAAYDKFLDSRNGTWNQAQRTFAKRERRLAALDAAEIDRPGTCSQDEFDRRYGSPETDPSVDTDMLTALIFAKLNAGEAYGVKTVRPTKVDVKRVASDSYSRILARLFDEEEIHTRLLVGATRCFGVTVDAPYEPRWPLKLLIRVMAAAPRSLYHPILLASEIAGAYVLNYVLRRVGQLFAKHPLLRDALESRLIDVLIDEVGHISFNRWWVGAKGLQIGCALAPHIVASIPLMTPELRALGFDHNVEMGAFSFDYERLPAEVRKHAFFA